MQDQQQQRSNSDPPSKPDTGGRVSMPASILATLVAVFVGGAITVVVAIFLLEALHTKDGVVVVIVTVGSIAIGSVAAIHIRRSVIDAISPETDDSD